MPEVDIVNIDWNWICWDLCLQGANIITAILMSHSIWSSAFNLQFRALLSAAGFIGIIVEKRETEMMENKSKVTIFNVILKMLFVGRLEGAEKGTFFWKWGKLEPQQGNMGFKKGNTGKMGNKIMVKI